MSDDKSKKGRSGESDIKMKKLNKLIILMILVAVFFQNCVGFSSAPLNEQESQDRLAPSIPSELPSESRATNPDGSEQWIVEPTATGTCLTDFHLESNKCVNNNKICSFEGSSGTQGWSNSKWSECRICLRSETSWQGNCYPNVIVLKSYMSLIMSGWTDGVLAVPALSENGYIGMPSQLVIDATQSVSFKIGYSRARVIELSSKHVQLEGPGASGCQLHILGSGLTERDVVVSSCKGLGPLRISIAAGSAISDNDIPFGSIGPSSDVIVFNSSVYIQTQFKNDYFGHYSTFTGETQDFFMYYPKEYLKRKDWPVMIWIHGGGWMGGTNKEDENLAQSFADAGFIVVNANYRVAKIDPKNSFADVSKIFSPLQTYETGPDDIKSLVRFVYNTVHLVNGDKNKISIAGSSAGGHLVMHQATRLDDDIHFKCVIDVAGPTNLLSLRFNQDYPVTQFIVGSVFGSLHSDLKKYSPSENFSSLRAERIIVLHQLRDNLVPIDQALEVLAKRKKYSPLLPMTFLIGSEYHDQPMNKPQYEQVTHAFFNESENHKILKAVSYSQCH